MPMLWGMPSSEDTSPVVDERAVAGDLEDAFSYQLLQIPPRRVQRRTFDGLRLLGPRCNPSLRCSRGRSRPAC